ncbi:MAG: ABC transporter ATP-binding protein [Gemmataceae bacterium]|nr:ABC transporter ATP-binding protein [Gemmataceae bacterium]
MTLIAVDRLSKHYSGVAALQGVSLQVAAGEFLALVGPSGSGKSTLMNLLGLLDAPTSGTYLLAGEDVSRLSPARRAAVRNRRIGFVFQGFHLLPRLTARQNVELPLIYAGIGFRARSQRADQLLERFGLRDRASHLPAELSGGQQQRVAIARALALEPPLILADEPTGNLDSATGAGVLAEFRRLHRDHGLTVILVTHDRDIAAGADRRVTLSDGRIVADESTVELRRAA